MGRFCTIEDIEAFLQIEVEAAKEDSAWRAIDEATEAIKNYCHQVIEQVIDDVYTFDVAAGQLRLFLPELPVTNVASVVEDGEPLVEGADEDYQVGVYGVLYRVGQNWAEGIQIVEVTYTHGYQLYDGLPDDIAGVCTRAAARAFQAGLKAESLGGVPGIASLGLGDYSVSYGTEGPEGTMGVSAARMLLLSEKDILNRYRYVRQ